MSVFSIKCIFYIWLQSILLKEEDAWDTCMSQKCTLGTLLALCMFDVWWDKCWALHLYTCLYASVNDAKVDPMAPMHLSHRKIMNLSARGGPLSAFSETDLHVLVRARIWSFEGLKFPFSWKRSCFVRSSVFLTHVFLLHCVSAVLFWKILRLSGLCSHIEDAVLAHVVKGHPINCRPSLYFHSDPCFSFWSHLCVLSMYKRTVCICILWGNAQYVFAFYEHTMYLHTLSPRCSLSRYLAPAPCVFKSRENVAK